MSANFCDRARESMQRFGLDPIDGPEDEVARAVAASRIREILLGLLLEWRLNVNASKRSSRIAPAVAADLSVAAERLDRVVRSARRRCGGAYARWQDLLDRNDVPGLAAFAASPDGLGFRSRLAADLGRDLLEADEHRACQAYLRAAVDRYPHDAWLHGDLASVCGRVQPPNHAEALHHYSAASALKPNSAWFLVMVASHYAELGAYDQAIASYRKVIAMSSFYRGIANLWMGETLSKKKDWEPAIAAIREAIRLLPERRGMMYVPGAYVALDTALAGAGRHAEGREEVLTALLKDPVLVDNPRTTFRYTAAYVAMRRADGKGLSPPAAPERTAYRKQALDLLTAELAAMRKLAATDRFFVRMMMKHWLGDTDFSSVRDPTAVDLLPPDERAAWRKLWADVHELRDRCAPQADPQAKSK